MKYMNDYDLDNAIRRFARGETPNRLALALTVANLADQTNNVSDGWAYWPKPCRAAEKAISLIESTSYPEYERREREDITDAELAAAVRPIRSFLTRHRDIYSAERREIILRPVTR
jgi:hypothetical protein